MKTKNNVQKTITKSLAVGLSLVLISITVSAQDFWKSLLESSGFNEIAMVMVEGNNEANSTITEVNSLAAYFEEEIEEEAKLEDWMTDETNFDANSMYFEVETEESLEIESWMFDATNFSNTAFQFIEETENELELEEWMLNEKLFDTYQEKEQALELEGWMISELVWEI